MKNSLLNMQETRKQELTERFIELVEQINQCMHSRPLEEWPDLELTMPQIKTLTLLRHQGPQRMGSIATYLGSTLSSSTSITDHLVDKGLVELAERLDIEELEIVVRAMGLLYKATEGS